jgi:hypothetical protein
MKLLFKANPECPLGLHHSTKGREILFSNMTRSHPKKKVYVDIVTEPQNQDSPLGMCWSSVRTTRPHLVDCGVILTIHLGPALICWNFGRQAVNGLAQEEEQAKDGKSLFPGFVGKVKRHFKYGNLISLCSYSFLCSLLFRGRSCCHVSFYFLQNLHL